MSTQVSQPQRHCCARLCLAVAIWHLFAMIVWASEDGQYVADEVHSEVTTMSYRHEESVPRNGHTWRTLVIARISGCQRQKEMSLEDQTDHGKEVSAEIYAGDTECRSLHEGQRRTARSAGARPD